ncbi:MAG: PAS domain-containing protein [Rhodospirillaceae bacterium]
MLVSAAIAETIIDPIVSQAANGEPALYSALDLLPAPVYVTDPMGFVTYFNRACIGFSGRMPVVGKDRWCVTWKLYTADGDYLPHEQCPMAHAIRSATRVRGLKAMAARPDGTRVTFTPFPTPLLGPAGELLGAVNILIDVSDQRQIDKLVAEAKRCRRLAAGIGDTHTAHVLQRLSEEYLVKAADLRHLIAEQALPTREQRI